MAWNQAVVSTISAIYWTRFSPQRRFPGRSSASFRGRPWAGERL